MCDMPVVIHTKTVGTVVRFTIKRGHRLPHHGDDYDIMVKHLQDALTDILTIHRLPGTQRILWITYADIEAPHLWTELATDIIAAHAVPDEGE